MSEDLFGGTVGASAVPAVGTGSLADGARAGLPLAVRMRPQTLDEIVGQQHLLAPGSPLRRLAAGEPMSVFLWGPPGVGKTTIASVVSRQTDSTFVEVSAVTAGVREVRAVLDQARRDLRTSRSTVLFVDEVHRFSKTQQDVLLPAVENRLVTLIAATTENPSFSVISPLLSRSLLLTLRPLTNDDVSGLLTRALTDERGLAGAYTLDDEARATLQDFVAASRRAVDAGLDGVELHGANGYLLHEFLSPASNRREDGYGGSPENRARFVIEVVTAVAAEIGAGRVGLRISPEHNIQGALETDRDDVRATYGVLLDALAPLGLAYLSVLHREPGGELVQELRRRFGGPLMANSGFGTVTTREEAVALIEAARADSVAVGRPVIANPDLVERWKGEHEENAPNSALFYAAGAEGYTDYPTLAAG